MAVSLGASPNVVFATWLQKPSANTIIIIYFGIITVSVNMQCVVFQRTQTPGVHSLFLSSFAHSKLVLAKHIFGQWTIIMFSYWLFPLILFFEEKSEKECKGCETGFI